MNKKKVFFGFILFSILTLVLIDYSLKVREYNNLVDSNKAYEKISQEWLDQTYIYFDNCLKPGYVPEGRADCVRVITKSDEFAGQLFLKRNDLDRYFVAPWHTTMKYAYEDLSTLIDYDYESISGWEIDYDPNGSGRNLKNVALDPGDYSERALQFNQSLADAKPALGFFLKQQDDE
jgi:hypothetical protein